jgi:hypothetical protein
MTNSKITSGFAWNSPSSRGKSVWFLVIEFRLLLGILDLLLGHFAQSRYDFGC